MKKIVRFGLPLLAACAFATASHAGTIVDTGAGAPTYYSGYALASYQWLGSQFTLDSAHTLSSVNGWMSAPGGGTLQMSIRSTVGGLPGNALFSTDITAPGGTDQKWVGASGLNWKLDAGSYFVAFEVPQAYSFHGSMAFDAPRPSGQMVFMSDSAWRNTSGAMGLQVFGDAAQGDVPEPASIALVGLALAGLAFSRRKRA
jgi:hypothetical protein